MISLHAWCWQTELMRCYIGYYQSVGCPFHAGISNVDAANYLERHEGEVYTKVFGEHPPSFAAAALEIMVSPRFAIVENGACEEGVSE